MSQRWQAVGSTVSDLTGPELNLRPPAPETNTLPLNQQAEKSRSNMEIKQIKQTSNLY